jgi:hypothetical protein
LNGHIVGDISGALRMAYVVCGKRQSKVVPVIGGVLLCVYPCFTESPVAQVAVGVVLLAAPYLVDF